VWIFVCLQGVFSQPVKIVHIPDDVKIEKDATRELFVKNLSEEEIYRPYRFFIIGDFIYMQRDKPVGILKIDLKGKIVCQAGRRGQGPGELSNYFSFAEYKGNIAVLDSKNQKVVIFNRKLDFLEEFRLKLPFSLFSVDKHNRFFFHGTPGSPYYFDVYSEDCRFLHRFGQTMTSPAEYKKRMTFDSVRISLHIPEEDGVWASFRNRYDLRYYKKMRLAVEIKARKDYFEVEKQLFGGREVFMPRDRVIHLARVKNFLYYIYRKDKQIYCDVFDIKEYRLQRRIKFKRYYNQVTHCRDNIFYAMGYETDDESDLFLFKLEVLD
jgi:hypothetical protein